LWVEPFTQYPRYFWPGYYLALIVEVYEVHLKQLTIFLKVRFIILNKIWGFRKSILSNKISLISKQFYCPLLLTSLLMSLSMLTISFFSISFSLFGCIFRLDWICIQMRKPLTTCRPTSVEKTIEKIAFLFFIRRRWPFVVLNKWLQNV
jgi:hypothetical protein